MRIEIEFVGGECDGRELVGYSDAPDTAALFWAEFVEQPPPDNHIGKQYRFVPESSLLRIADGGGLSAHGKMGGKIPHVTYQVDQWIQDEDRIKIRLNHLRTERL